MMSVHPYFALSRVARLRRTVEFQYVYRRGKSVANRDMVMIYAKGKGPMRIGFTAGKKVGNSVVRNRVKRLMRESFRLMQYDFAGGWRIIFVARQGMVDAGLAQVQRSMRQLLSRSSCAKKVRTNG